MEHYGTQDMVTRLPRLQITLSPEAHEAIGDVAELTGQSRAGIVAEFIESGLPVLLQMRDAVRLMKSAPLEAQRAMAKQANLATLELAQAQLDLDAHIDMRSMEGKRLKRRGRNA